MRRQSQALWPLSCERRCRVLEKAGVNGHGAGMMPRAYLLRGTLLLLPLLSGCAGSGFYSYLGDTFQPPFGSNPNAPHGSSETDAKVLGRLDRAPAPAPILYEAGDVWPAAPKAPPTLKDLQKQQNRDLAAGADTTPETYAPLAPLPTLPGYEVPQQETRRASPVPSFPGGIVPLPGGRPGVITGGGGGVNSVNGPTGNGSIMVPNGNGTSTVIGPNGTVSTVPTPGK